MKTNHYFPFLLFSIILASFVFYPDSQVPLVVLILVWWLIGLITIFPRLGDFISSLIFRKKSKIGKINSVKIDRGWLRRMADLEDGCCVSVGGLAVEMGMDGLHTKETNMEPKKTHGSDCDCNRCAVVSLMVRGPEFFQAVKDGMKDLKANGGIEDSLSHGVSVVDGMLAEAETRLEESRK